MKLDLSELNYSFTNKPLLVGGKAKEYYGIRKSGEDTDLIIAAPDYQALAALYPDNCKELWGDLGIVVGNLEIWKTIRLFDYSYLSAGAIEMKNYKIISLEKLLFLTALAMKNEKYLKDLYLIVDKVNQLQYQNQPAGA